MDFRMERMDPSGSGKGKELEAPAGLTPSIYYSSLSLKLSPLPFLSPLPPIVSKQHFYSCLKNKAVYFIPLETKIPVANKYIFLKRTATLISKKIQRKARYSCHPEA